MGLDLTGLGSIGTFLDDLLKFIPNPADKAAAQAKVLEFFAQINKSQSDTNTAEATQGFFIAGWRPFCGWAFGIGTVYALLVQPVIFAVCHFLSIQGPPAVDASVIIGLLSGMLGLAGMRTYEKKTGVA